MTTKAQKDWLSTLADYGCVVSRERQPIQLHHVMGRTYKHNKVLIGPWYVLPLAFRYHDVSSDNPFNVTHYRKKFAIEKGYQRDLFRKMCLDMIELGVTIPFDQDVMDAIMDSPLR